jgi:hypothetical protein
LTDRVGLSFSSNVGDAYDISGCPWTESLLSIPAIPCAGWHISSEEKRLTPVDDSTMISQQCIGLSACKAKKVRRFYV